MKKLIAIICVVLLMGGVVMLSGFTASENEKREDLFRIHIVANSNESKDSEVKYEIKDKFSTFLTPMLANCESKQEAQKIVSDNLENLKYIANSVLSLRGLNYTATINIGREFFPSRAYGEYVVESGEYSGITVTLGEGKGDNWWCVLFPPLCYYNVTANYANSNEVVYKVKILEIIKQFFEK